MKLLAFVRMRNPVGFAERGIEAVEKAGRFGVHVVFNAGETSNPDFDGWRWFDTIEEARKRWKEALSECKAVGYTEEVFLKKSRK